jgi:GT2 family glycosyltransferase
VQSIPEAYAELRGLKMESTRASRPLPSIQAVVVLYRCELSASQSVSSLVHLLNENPEFAGRLSLMLYDNSPQAHACNLQANFPIEYIHDASNGGLASAYNTALRRAESDGHEWLLLLDQDTSPTREFLFELLETATALHATAEVAAIVPKLVVHGVIHSPATQFIIQMRRQFRRPAKPIAQDAVGVLQQPLSAYNSGATIRVSALRSIGGFPPEFWLDYLDHAVFHALYVRGYRIHVMLAKLMHEASYSDPGSVPFWRLHNVLMAQTLYVKRSGNVMDRLLYRIWLLRHSRNFRKGEKNRRMWRETVLQAFLLRVPKQSARGER